MRSTSGTSTTRRQRGLGPRAGLPRTTIAAVTAALAVVVLAGCGSSAPTGAAAPSTTAADATSAPSSTSTTAASSTASAPSSPASAAPSSAPRADVTIHISGYKYTGPASVAPGATISIMNMDDVNHTVTADEGGAFDVKAIGGMTTTFVAPTKPGSYPFHCTYHANMHGILVVK